MQEQLDKVASNNGLSISKGYKEYIEKFDTSGRGNQVIRLITTHISLMIFIYIFISLFSCQDPAVT